MTYVNENMNLKFIKMNLDNFYNVIDLLDGSNRTNRINKSKRSMINPEGKNFLSLGTNIESRDLLLYRLYYRRKSSERIKK